MAHVEIRFSRCDDMGSIAIRLYEHGDWSHVDAVMPDNSLLGARDDVCAGIPAGVQKRPQGYAPFTAVRSVAIPCTDDQEKSLYDFLNTQIGKGYDETAIAGFIADRNWRNPDKWFCSELITAALENAGIFRKLSSTANKVTPGDLFLVCSALTDV